MKHSPYLHFGPRLFVTSLLTACLLLEAISATAQTLAPAVDPAATHILKRMCDYLGGLKQFSVTTQNTLEDMLDSGQKVDIDISASAVVRRPNKIRVERKGELVDQVFYYDGKTLTLYNPSDKVYATVPAPATIDGTLGYATGTLGLIIPASDLVYTNAYSLLMKDVTFGTVVGRAVINGVECDQLLFSRPGVDFQVWVATGGKPLPHKYVVTDTTIPELLSLTTVMSDWDVAPSTRDSLFNFSPPKDVTAITFLPLTTPSGSNR